MHHSASVSYRIILQSLLQNNDAVMNNIPLRVAILLLVYAKLNTISEKNPALLHVSNNLNYKLRVSNYLLERKKSENNTYPVTVN